MKKRILSGLLCLFLAVTFLPQGVMAEETAATETAVEDVTPMTEEEMANDPSCGRETGDAADEFYEEDELVGSRSTPSTYSGSGYIHNTKFDLDNIVNGVDVSYYQGNINWTAVKADGIDYAFIRVGYRGSQDGVLYEDAYFQNNVKAAISAGVKVGVYFASQAITETEAQEEANFVTSRISSYNITMPVAFDYEFDANNTGRLYKAKLTTDKTTKICNAFTAKVENSGYESAVYASKTMLETYLTASAINSMVWLANYTSETTYAGDYKFWQYTNKGTVNGITGQVDMNFWYDDGIRNYDENLAVTDNSHIRYTDASGNIRTNQFYCDGTYTYYLQADGSPMTNKLSWDPEGTGLIYFDEQGHMLFDTFKYCKDVGYTCYFATNGRAYFDQLTFYHNKAYYMDGNGKMQTDGWFQFANKVDYGFARSDGSLVTDTFGYDKTGREVYYYWNGMVARGLISDGTYYYHMDETDGHFLGKFK